MAGVNERGTTVITMGVAMIAAHKTMEKLARRGMVADTVDGVNKVDPVLTADMLGKAVMNSILEKRNAK